MKVAVTGAVTAGAAAAPANLLPNDIDIWLCKYLISLNCAITK